MKKRNSIKKKLFQIIMVSTLACVLVSVVISLVAVYSVEQQQIQSSMRFGLSQIRSSIDQEYLGLMNVMRGLEAGGDTGSAAENFLEEKDGYQKAVKKQILDEQISDVLFLNLNVRAVSYAASETGELLFGSGTVSEIREEQNRRKEIWQVGDRIFYTIEQARGQGEGYLISMLSKNQNFGEYCLDIFLEKRVEPFEKSDYRLLLLDQNGRVCYTESEDFTMDEEIPLKENGENYSGFEQNGNYLMTAESGMGFTYGLAVPLSVYYKESNMWRMRMAVVMVGCFCLFYLIVLAIYQMIGKPIQKLKLEIAETGKGNLGAVKEDTGIEEFNQVLDGINRMRRDLRATQEKEKQEEELRKKAEAEKLMYQINPHFVLNTLYSVQWMAQQAGNTRIREFIHNFMAILSYNLGKENAVSSLRTEVEIARKYIEIQKERYDFEVRLEVEEGDYLDTPAIRMLLQPLIENALQHGLGTSGRLEIWIFEDPRRQYGVIIVRDYGEGLSREKLEELNRPLGAEDSKKTRNGIGLRYVRSMLETVYGSEAILDVNSTRGRGTKVTILLPLVRDDGKEGEIFD